MTLKPILFNTEMVRKILSGEKTVTRRVVNPLPPEGARLEYSSKYGEALDYATGTLPMPGERIAYKAPYKPGDILYVRERWRVGAWDIPRQLMAFDYADGTCGELVHIEDREMFLRLVDQSREDARKAKCEYNGVDFVWEKGQAPTRWHPSIHMPKEAARIFLRVTDVRVERLQEITDEGAEHEGICGYYVGMGESAYSRYSNWNEAKNHLYDCPRGAFADLWTHTLKPTGIGKYGWAANPWVWVIEFERCEKPKETAT